MNNRCLNCLTMNAALLDEIARRNADNQFIAAVEALLAEFRGMSMEFVTVDYVRRKLEDAAAMRAK